MTVPPQILQLIETFDRHRHAYTRPDCGETHAWSGLERSYDPEGGPLSYHQIQTGGWWVAMDVATERPTFHAPSVVRDLAFTLMTKARRPLPQQSYP